MVNILLAFLLQQLLNAIDVELLHTNFEYIEQTATFKFDMRNARVSTPGRRIAAQQPWASRSYAYAQPLKLRPYRNTINLILKVI